MGVLDNKSPQDPAQEPHREPSGRDKPQPNEKGNGFDDTASDDAGAGTAIDEIEISIFEKPVFDGPLAKTGQLGPDGKPDLDASHCWMSTGTVKIASFRTMASGAALIAGLSSQQAIGIGIPKNGLAANGPLKIVSRKLLNGASNVIARTKEHFGFGQKAALMFFDVDTKWLTTDVAAKISSEGAYWNELTKLAPGLSSAARIRRASSSAGLSANGTKFPSSSGQHVLAAVKDGDDIPRATRVMHERAMLAGLGGLVLGKVGQMLERSIVDIAVASPERLVFEGPPVLKPPLMQDPEVRKPVAYEGRIIDTKKAIPNLSRQERVQLDMMIDAQKKALAGEATRLRAAADQKIAEHLVKTTGLTIETALRQVALRHVGLLPPELELEFDDPVLGVVTVKDVMAQPSKFVDETLADPLEGVGYGRGKAIVLRGVGGDLIIHSFAHGRTIYRLVHNEATLQALIAATGSDAVVSTVISNFNPDALPLDAQERLLKATAKKAGVGIKIVRQMLRDAVARRKAEERAEKQSAREAFDERARMYVPKLDAPVQEVATRVDALLAAVKPSSPDKLPMRRIDGKLASIKVQSLPEDDFHELSDDDDDDAGDGAGGKERAQKPAPATLLLVTLENNNEIAMLVEDHIRIEKKDADGNRREVSLPVPHRDPLNSLNGSVLPMVVGIATVPMVRVDPRRGNCELIEAEGLHRKTGVYFDIPEDIRAALPQAAECSGKAVAKSVRFLCDEWLVDVKTDEAGKATTIAMALTLLQRHRLTKKPAFMANAAQAGSGKTTLVNMVAMAATGDRAAAAGWSSSKEERKKALFSFLLSDVALLCFDNIARGNGTALPGGRKGADEQRDNRPHTGEERYGKGKNGGGTGVDGKCHHGAGRLGDASAGNQYHGVVGEPGEPARAAWRAGGMDAAAPGKDTGGAVHCVDGARPRTKIRDRKTRFKRWWWEVGLAVEQAFEGRVDFAAMFDASIERDAEGAALAEFLGALVEQHGDREFTAADVAWMLDRHPPGMFDANGATVDAFDTADSRDKHINRADAMRGWLSAALGRGALQGALTAVEVGYHLRSFADRVVDMPGQGEACLTNRKDRSNTSLWRVEWKRRTARAEIEAVATSGSNEERRVLLTAITECGLDILSVEYATEKELAAVWERFLSLKS